MDRPLVKMDRHPIRRLVGKVNICLRFMIAYCTSHRPHLGHRRQPAPGQLVHETALARLGTLKNATWRNLPTEKDLYLATATFLVTLWERAKEISNFAAREDVEVLSTAAVTQLESLLKSGTSCA